MTRLVLLSGWGIDARIWQPLVAALPGEFEISTPDWPGYGTRREVSMPQELAGLAEAMAADLPPDALWVGWSLGGLLATALLDYLPAPRSLMLLGMRERFTTTRRGSKGVTPEALAAFRAAFAKNPRATWRHFLRWQLSGEPRPRLAHQRLLSLIGDTPPASDASLATGLDRLAGLDNRSRCAASPCPLYALTGAQDPLAAMPDDGSRIHELPPIAQAGHCPQLSQPEVLARRLTEVASTLTNQSSRGCLA